MDTKWLDEFVLERMRRTRLPGVSLALMDEEEVLYARGYGFHDLERALPATPTTLYGIGSVTKSFTALAIMRLAEEGKLSPEDPVERYLPLRVRPFGEPIRIGHLLTHTSGLPALAYAEAQIRWAQGTGGQSLPLASVEDFLTWVNGAADWVEARPGERWFYLNEGYVLLGAIIERVSGLAYAEYLRRETLAPLGMTSTGFLGEELPELAKPYVIPTQGQPRPGKIAPIPIGSDGALVSSVLDLARYIQMFLRGGAPLLRPGSLAEMIRPRIPLPHRPSPAFPEEVHIPAYAYGLMVQPFLEATLIGHGGSVLVYTAYLGFVPERRLGVAVLANGSGYPMAQLAQVALALAMGADPHRLPFLRLEGAVEAVAGVYGSYREGMRVSVRPKDGVLELVVEDKEAPQSVYLPVEGVAREEVRCLGHLGDRVLPVIFRMKAGEVELLYERYKLRRLSPWE